MSPLMGENHTTLLLPLTQLKSIPVVFALPIGNSTRNDEDDYGNWVEKGDFSFTIDWVVAEQSWKRIRESVQNPHFQCSPQTIKDSALE
jgi:hypothetical protein